MVSLSKDSGVPLYVQIREYLRESIQNGTYLPSEKIPSEDELADLHGVSRMTARAGISALIDEGLLYRRHGVGTFVSQSQIARDQTRLTSFFEDAEVINLSPTSEMLEMLRMPASHKIAQALRLENHERVFMILTLRFVKEQVVTLHYAYLPEKLFPNLINEVNDETHLWQHIEETYGLKLKNAIQRLEARSATPYQAEMLEISEKSPVLYKERTVYADDGTPVEYSECYNRADRYACTVALQR